MSTMRLYTTPSYVLHVEGVDLSAVDLYVTFRQEDTIVTKTDATATFDGTESVINVTLTQAESGQFAIKPGVYCQVNWLDDGERHATNIVEIPPRGNLLEEVLS